MIEQYRSIWCDLRNKVKPKEKKFNQRIV